MSASGTRFLHQLLVLVGVNGLTALDVSSWYFLVRRPMSWGQSQEFCQRHFVDLAVMSTEKEYFYLQSATAGERLSFWIGLRRREEHSWTWLDGQDVHYEKWRENKVGDCGSFEAMLTKSNKILSRICEEPHASVCQGPVGPQGVSWVSHSNSVSMSWNVSTFMQMTSHNYTVTVCSSQCQTFNHEFIRGSASITVHISNLTSATNYTFDITASVTRRDNNSGRIHILKSSPTTLQIHTGVESFDRVPNSTIKLFLILAPLLWLIYLVFKKGKLKKSSPDKSFTGINTEDCVVDVSLFTKT